jgi:hypothetical protein
VKSWIRITVKIQKHKRLKIEPCRAMGAHSPMQIAMAIWHAFFNPTNSHYIQQPGVTPNPTQQVQILITINVCNGLSHPVGWAALPFENILRRFLQGQRNPLRIQHGVYFL